VARIAFGVVAGVGQRIVFIHKKWTPPLTACNGGTLPVACQSQQAERLASQAQQLRMIAVPRIGQVDGEVGAQGRLPRLDSRVAIGRTSF
jgi:hypothetical protein